MENPRALVVRHDAMIRSVQFNDKLIAFAKHWGFRPRACAPYRMRRRTVEGLTDKAAAASSIVTSPRSRRSPSR